MSQHVSTRASPLPIINPTSTPTDPTPTHHHILSGGDAIDVFHYMAKFGLPDESCLHYMASDYTAFKEKGMKRCPPEKFCVK